jgi:2-isopropylmalate synthase
MMNANRVRIFDTTLRDGEQSPGCSMTPSEKLKMAKALAELGVDIIEAGFPAASPGDWESVASIAKEVSGPIICGLARCHKDDIEKAYSAIQVAPKHRIHVFLATSAIHRQHKLNMAKEEIIKTAVEGVRFARSLTADVEFSPEDASRTELEFLAEVVTAVIDAGASTVNIPDTVGYTTPQEFTEVFTYLKKHVPNIDQAVLSVHCHDDLGMAVANSLSACAAGARQIECTINGIGERAGNASLEEVVMALKTRESFYGLTTGIHTQKLFPTSRLLATITGQAVPRNKAIVGENAFAHESGIHQHGMLKHHSTYEIMRPADVGLSRTNLVLGKHSGRHAFRDRVKDLGYDLSEAELNLAFQQFKVLADKKKELLDGDIEAIVLHGGAMAQGPWTLTRLQSETQYGQLAKARVELTHVDGRRLSHEASGDGPIYAVFKAIEEITQAQVTLETYGVHGVTGGEDAQGEAVVSVSCQGRLFRGSRLATNIIESSALAFLDVINQIQSTRTLDRKVHPQKDATPIGGRSA